MHVESVYVSYIISLRAVSTPDHLLDLACGDLPGRVAAESEEVRVALVAAFQGRTIGECAFLSFLLTFFESRFPNSEGPGMHLHDWRLCGSSMRVQVTQRTGVLACTRAIAVSCTRWLTPCSGLTHNRAGTGRHGLQPSDFSQEALQALSTSASGALTAEMLRGSMDLGARGTPRASLGAGKGPRPSTDKGSVGGANGHAMNGNANGHTNGGTKAGEVHISMNGQHGKGKGADVEEGVQEEGEEDEEQLELEEGSPADDGAKWGAPWHEQVGGCGGCQ